MKVPWSWFPTGGGVDSTVEPATVTPEGPDVTSTETGPTEHRLNIEVPLVEVPVT